MEVIDKHKVGYKKTKIGLIPDDWGIKKLEQVALVNMGQSPDSETYNTEEKGLYLIQGNADIKDRKSSPRIWTSSPTKTCNVNDILMSVRAPVGTIAKSNHNACIGRGICSIRSEIINEEFLYQFLLSYESSWKSLEQGSTFTAVNGKDIKGLKVPFPPISEQQKIASILSDWDKAIENTQTLIEKLQLRKKGLMQQLLTGKTRLNGFSEEWKEYKFGDVTTKFSKRNKELINARVYSVTNDRGFILQTEMFEREVAGDDLTGYKIIKKNEFAYNPARVNVGSIALFKDEIGIISSLYVCFKTNEKLINDYLINLLETDELKHRIIRYGEGGVRIYLWYYLFEAIKIKLPSADEQKAILEILDAADQEINQQQNYLAQLQAQKKGLMQQLLTGKIRVKA